MILPKSHNFRLILYNLLWTFYCSLRFDRIRDAYIYTPEKYISIQMKNESEPQFQRNANFPFEQSVFHQKKVAFQNFLNCKNYKFLITVAMLLCVCVCATFREMCMLYTGLTSINIVQLSFTLPLSLSLSCYYD